MNRGGFNARTGRENTTLFYCTTCDWEREHDRLTAGAPLCPRCGARLFWIAYEKPIEEAEARAIVTKAREKSA